MQKPVTVKKRKHETKIERKKRFRKKIARFWVGSFSPRPSIITLAKNFDCMNFNNESEQKND
jgi:hypothetical protein